MDGFSTPRKEVKAVDLEQADPERKALYGKLAGMDDEAVEEAQQQVEQLKTEAQLAGPVLVPILEEDKQEFLRCLMGTTKYTKTVLLCGQIPAVFADRSIKDTRLLYKYLNTISQSEDASVEMERCLLALQLKQYAEMTYEPVTSVEEIVARLAVFDQLVRPLYSALLTACLGFEKHVADLIAKALSPDFWVPGALS